MDELLPASLRDRYRPLRLLGQGGMSRVVLAEDGRLGSQVALKLLLGGGDPELRERLMREGGALATLSHPNLVRILDQGSAEVDGREVPYLVMEHLEGRDLTSPPDGLDRLGAMLQVAHGLQALHEAGLVHRDVKPSNIVLVGERPVLIDLGLASGSDQEAITETGAVVGTLGFIAPEVARGAEAGPPADWFAWGVTLYALFEGELPFPADHYLRTRKPARVEFGRIPKGSRRAAALLRCLDPDPTRRPAGRDELVKLLTGPRPSDVPSPDSSRDAAPASGAHSVISGSSPRHSGESAPGARSRLRIPLALVATLGIGVALGRLSRGPSPGTPPPSPPHGEPGPTPASSPDGRPDAVLRWARRTAEVDGPALSRDILGALHRDLAMEGNEEKLLHRTLGVMREARVTRVTREDGEAPRSDGEESVDPGESGESSRDRQRSRRRRLWRERLRAQAARTRSLVGERLAGLPWRAELQAEREELGRTLRDPAIPYRYRLELLGALQRLELVDVLARQWGLPLPYRVGPVLGELAPVQTALAPRTQEPPAAGPGPLGPGTHLLAAWETKADRDLPLLVPSTWDSFVSAETVSDSMAIGGMLAMTVTQGKWSHEVHERLQAHFRLAESEVSLLRGAALELRIGTLAFPVHLELRLNDTLIRVFPDPDVPMPRGLQDMLDPELDVRLRVELPAEALVPGENQATATARTFPGFPSVRSLRADRLRLVLDG